ncbi:phosphoribosylamine-glycine ligase [Colletotrichum sublineola]|nr:phosphoribosylamine-glycine ligase [Colletotrichum sublineola]
MPSDAPQHRILLVGKGGREHALAWKLSHSPSVEHVFVFPGNGGTAKGLLNVSNVNEKVEDYADLVSVSKRFSITLVVVGPDDDVVNGIEGFFRDSGIPCFAPTKQAAEIEGSKAYAKDLMRKYGIPTATYMTFEDVHQAKSYVDSVAHRVVIKASGLAAGKGVVLPTSKEEANEVLEDMLVRGKYASAGTSVVIEEYMEGEEISVLTFSDGESILSLPPGQDHKSIFENNTGPNTGGMGVYAPVPFVDDWDMSEIEERILRPTFAALKAEGRTFRGMLFTGIMMTKDGPKVLEYNARFGDPETQSLMLLLSAETDLAEILLACTQRTLHKINLLIRPGFACNVVVTAEGYPERYKTGDHITIGSPLPEGVEIFHAGTKLDSDGTMLTAGGRVLSVASYGDSLQDAVGKAYRTIERIHFQGMYFRKDIARRFV